MSLILDSNEKYFFPLFHSDQSQLEIFYSFLFRTKSSEFEIDRKKFGIQLEFSEPEKRRRNPGVVETEDQEDRGSNRSDRRWVFTAGFYADIFTS